MPSRRSRRQQAGAARARTSSTPTRPTTSLAAAAPRRGGARKGIEPKERPGRHRWVVERTLAWLTRYRRLAIRYERRDDIHAAFLSLGCSLICFNALQRP